MKDCIFCKIAKGEVSTEKIYEDENCFAFLDLSPINLGHTLVIPKEHYENIYEIPDELLSKMSVVIKKLMIAIKKGVDAEGMNLGMNNERAAGQLIFHAHFHLMPRYTNDGHTHWKGSAHGPEETKRAAEKIKKSI